MEEEGGEGVGKRKGREWEEWKVRKGRERGREKGESTIFPGYRGDISWPQLQLVLGYTH